MNDKDQIFNQYRYTPLIQSIHMLEPAKLSQAINNRYIGTRYEGGFGNE
jgi:hypothetical protein